MLCLILRFGLAIYPDTRPQESAAKPLASHPDGYQCGRCWQRRTRPFQRRASG
jgi:hypothetical protein